MSRNYLDGFKVFFERHDDTSVSFYTGRERSLNIDDEKEELIDKLSVPPNFKFGVDTNGRMDPGSRYLRYFSIEHPEDMQGDDDSIVSLVDVTGACDEKGMNAPPNIAASCSPTSGWRWRIKRKLLPYLKMPIPPGSAGGGGGAMGGGGALGV